MSNAKTMAEEIMLHSPIGRDEQGQYCKACNHRYGYAADRLLHQWASAHIAEVLSAAGFGLVADAKAEALEEAAEHLARLEYVRPEHPNRAAYEKILAVRRGNTDAWLKARAGLIRTAS